MSNPSLRWLNSKKGAVALSEGFKTYAFAARPFIVTLSSRGFTQIFSSLRREPPLQNSPSALMTGRLRQVGFRAAGAAALIPSCAPSGSGSSSRSFKATLKGHAATAQADPDAGCTVPFHIRTTQKPGSKESGFCCKIQLCH